MNRWLCAWYFIVLLYFTFYGLRRRYNTLLFLFMLILYYIRETYKQCVCVYKMAGLKRPSLLFVGLISIKLTKFKFKRNRGKTLISWILFVIFSFSILFNCFDSAQRSETAQTLWYIFCCTRLNKIKLLKLSKLSLRSKKKKNEFAFGPKKISTSNKYYDFFFLLLYCKLIVVRTSLNTFSPTRTSH